MARPGLESDGFVNHAFQLMSFRVTVAPRFRACDKARVHPVAQVVRVLLAAARHDQVDLPTRGRDQDIEAPRLLGDAHHGTCCRQLAIQEDLKDHPWLACDEGAIVPVHQVIVHPGKCDEAPVRRVSASRSAAVCIRCLWPRWLKPRRQLPPSLRRHQFPPRRVRRQHPKVVVPMLARWRYQ